MLFGIEIHYWMLFCISYLLQILFLYSVYKILLAFFKSLIIWFREYSKALIRLTKMIRGIGDPLVAAYARCYLCRVSNLT